MQDHDQETELEEHERKCGKKCNKDRKKKKSLCQKNCCELDFPV
jgi:hypothetical protein